MRTSEALPVDEGVPKSVPIHCFIARTMMPMFEVKNRVIRERLEVINEGRRMAFKKAGETPTRVGSIFLQSQSQGGSSSSSRSRKRQPGDPVIKHSTNKRDHIGLESIPANAKSATFNKMSDQTKVDIFNNIIKTAFPNFDNLMMASWNVVTVYSNVGTDFPELHKTVVELKSVLQDFEEAFGVRGVKRVDPKIRTDYTAPAQVPVKEENNRSSVQPKTEPEASPGFGPVVEVESDSTDPEAEHESDKESIAEADPESDPEVDPEIDLETEPADTQMTFDDVLSSRSSSSSPKVIVTRVRNVSSPLFYGTPEPAERVSPIVIPSPKTREMPPPPLPAHVLQRQRQREKDDKEAGTTTTTRPSPAPSPSPSGPKRLKHVRDVSPPETANPSAELLRRREEYLATLGNHKRQKLATSSSVSSPASSHPSSPPPSSSPSKGNEASKAAAAMPSKQRLASLSLTDLNALYHSRKHKLAEMFGGGQNVPKQYRVELQAIGNAIGEKEEEEKRVKESGGGGGGGGGEGSALGGSALGSVRQGGMAPVAPMLHIRKEK
ncbi:hypothetical protein GQ44DRAFT_197400 [Phaeosphaeriaceae sp. PMI808]|nr:hypothetical protein GQ44DRAFT_197400 [Phaeosphaeriaceae sp. PMI808]